MFSILLVEDSLDMQVLVKKVLSQYRVISTEDPDHVAGILKSEKIDLILLDIVLPNRDGYSVLHELQSDSRYAGIPVICLSGKDQVTDIVTAFSLGADDYVQKPFNPLELKARVDAKILKHQKRAVETEVFTVGGVKLDLSAHKAFTITGDKEIALTQTEFKLLHHLGKHPGNVFSREQLLQSVWGDEGAVFDRAVDVHVCALRKKVGEFGLEFKSVPTVGYKLVITA